MDGAIRLLRARAPLFMLGGVALGLALPPLAEAVRPAVVSISIAMVVVSMLRVEPARFFHALRNPAYLAAAGLFVLVALPVATAATFSALGAPAWLTTGLTYASAAPPLSSAAAFAILVRIDPALVTAVSLPATLAAPATVWLVTAALPGLGEGVALGSLVLRLLAIISFAILVAVGVRRVAGGARVAGWAGPLDALTVLLVVAIGVGVMHDIGLALRADPLQWLLILGAAALVSWASLGLAVAAFWPLGRDEALTAGLCAAIKNMAVMVAAVLGTVEPRISLVVITAQLPIFFAPLIMRPLFRRLRGREAGP